MEQVYRIGIDHGYGNIKTSHHIFESGVIERERASELAGMTVEFEGKFYEIGSTHKEYQMDKVWDEDYYILTLAALAKELKGRGYCHRGCRMRLQYSRTGRSRQEYSRVKR